MQYILNKFSQRLKAVEGRLGDTTDEGEDCADLQKAYGYLLSACMLKETPPPEDVSIIISMLIHPDKYIHGIIKHG